MAKLPAFLFYPADWRKDPSVQSLSFFDRGVWFEILCLMHASDERGKLLLNGKPMPDEALARLLGLDKQILTKTLTTLLDYGVASRNEQGALICRRMVRDENLRKIRTEAGKKGGNPNLLNQNSTKTKKRLNQKSTPSVTSSIAFKNTQNGVCAKGEGIPADEIHTAEKVPKERDEYERLIFNGLAERRMDSPFENPEWQTAIEFSYEKDIPPEQFFGCIDFVKSWATGRVTPKMVTNNFGKYLETVETNGNYVNPNTGRGLK